MQVRPLLQSRCISQTGDNEWLVVALLVRREGRKEVDYAE